MGLGKTVQMIATMAMNPPSEDDKNKTTLIVVPAALLHQVRFLLHSLRDRPSLLWLCTVWHER